MTRNLFSIILLVVGMMANAVDFKNVNLDIDSLANKGKFAEQCVSLYHRIDKTFNRYDSVFVVGTRKKFNLKVQTQSWIDYYTLNLPNDIKMNMLSEQFTSTGFKLSFMAVSVGYDVSRFTGNSSHDRSTLSFGFNCSRITVDLYKVKNNVTTTLTRFKNQQQSFKPKHKFEDINNKIWGIEMKYYFNDRKYSEAATFNLSKIQRISQGSLFAGLIFRHQSIDYDFKSFPSPIDYELENVLNGYEYTATLSHCYLTLGYGYNYVLNRKWTIGITEAPSFGFYQASFLKGKGSTTFGWTNRIKISGVWNDGNWFGGIMGNVEFWKASTNDFTFKDIQYNISVSVGYRFNLW